MEKEKAITDLNYIREVIKISHFTVLIIGENPEEQLYPFWELDLSREELEEDSRAVFDISFAKEDLEKEFIKFKEENKEDIEKGEKEWWIKYRTCSAREWIDSWNGEYLNKEKTHYGHYDNPNASWDWNELGGRWAGKLRVRKGVKFDKPNFSYGCSDEEKKKVKGTDSARKKDILPSCLKELKTFAVIKNGEWFETGKMGYWGCHSATESDEEDWDNNFYDKFIKELPEDTLLSVFDCHI